MPNNSKKIRYHPSAVVHIGFGHIQPPADVTKPEPNIPFLPDDIVLRIIGWYRLLVQATERARSYGTPSAVDLAENVGLPGAGWLRITHVCRDWRGIALHDASLWKDVLVGPHTTTDLVQATAERARSGLLEVEVACHKVVSEKQYRALEWLLKYQLRRLKSLKLSIDAPKYQHLWRIMARRDRRALSMETFEVCITDGTSQLPVSGLIDADPMNLKHFVIIGCHSLDWYYPALGSMLKILRVKTTARGLGDLTLSLDEFLDVLYGMPLLEELYHEGKLPRALRESTFPLVSTDREEASLSFLRILHVGDEDVATSAKFLACLDTPALQFLGVSAYVDSADESLDPLTMAVNNKLDQMVHGVGHKEEWDTLCLDPDASKTGASIRGHNEFCFWRITICALPTANTRVSGVLANFISSLAVRNIRTLNYAMEHPDGPSWQLFDSTEDYWTAFGPMQDVRAMYLGDQQLDVWIRLLREVVNGLYILPRAGHIIVGGVVRERDEVIRLPPLDEILSIMN